MNFDEEELQQALNAFFSKEQEMEAIGLLQPQRVILAALIALLEVFREFSELAQRAQAVLAENGTFQHQLAAMLQQGHESLSVVSR